MEVHNEFTDRDRDLILAFVLGVVTNIIAAWIMNGTPVHKHISQLFGKKTAKVVKDALPG